MRRHILFLALASLFPASAALAAGSARKHIADTHATSGDEDVTHHRVALSGTLTSSDSYSLDVSYHYMLCRYVGVGGAIGYWANYFYDGYASGSNWHISTDDEKPMNIYLRPSVVLKSPALSLWDTKWAFYAEPGVLLNLPYQRVCIERTTNWSEKDYDYRSTTAGQWFAVDLRLGLNVDIGPVGISIGYMMSNLDIYSQYRHLWYNGVSFREFYPRKSFMQGGFLSLSYSF